MKPPDKTIRDDRVYVEHILQAIARASECADEISESEFYDDWKTQAIIVRQIEIIGEATKNLTKEIKQTISTIPWSDIVGMRDKLIHHYMGVDLQAVWLVVKSELPILNTALLNWMEQRQP